MQGREVPRREWQDFFDTFSTQHEGWITTVEIGGDERVEGRELPLVGVTADRKGSERNSIEIEIGGDASDTLTHIVRDAERVVFDQTEDESQLEFEIESAGGETTTVRLRRGSRAEMPARARKPHSRRATG